MADLDNIKIIKEKRKSLAVEVYPNFSVVIKSPEQAKDFEIKDFIKRKTPWIEKQINYFKQFNMPEDKIYESGSSALYLGRQYQVIIEKSVLRNIVKVFNNKIYILTPFTHKLDEINQALRGQDLTDKSAEDIIKLVLKQMIYVALPRFIHVSTIFVWK